MEIKNKKNGKRDNPDINNVQYMEFKKVELIAEAFSGLINPS